MARVAIIGGGASGLTASIYAALKHEVTLFERNKECGKKILLTGNGKCNYWNEDTSNTHFHTENQEKLQEVLAYQNEVFSFFEELGLTPYSKNGYWYPYSLQAVSVRNALVRVAKLRHVQIKENFLAEEIIKKGNTFYINPNKENLAFDKVVLACGSKASPRTGSDGLGYTLATKLNHTVLPVYPSLVQLISDESFTKQWAGVRSEIKATLKIDNKAFKEEKGEIQFTDYGVSGIIIFNLSRDVKKSLMAHQKVEIIINFLPFLSKEKILPFLEKRNEKLADQTLEEMLEGLVNYKLIPILLKKAHVKNTQKWQDCSLKEKENLSNSLGHFSIHITDTKDFSSAQCSRGGIPLDEINMHTMESLKTKDLYVIGELLDVDGDCGGYNLGFAWLSGIRCGKSL